jgi:hypothetical protein
MATIGSTALTMADWAKRVDDGGRIASIVELLSQTNEIMDDMLMVEGNLPTGHKSTVRTGLPQATWRLLNYGVPQGKSTTAQITDVIGNLETSRSRQGHRRPQRQYGRVPSLSEVRAFLEGMTQQVASTLIYGNTAVNPERLWGSRHDTTRCQRPQRRPPQMSSTWAAYRIDQHLDLDQHLGRRHNARNFPQGQDDRTQHKDMGLWPVLDANNNKYMAYQDHFKWDWAGGA